jgi:hypothetical protein
MRRPPRVRRPVLETRPHVVSCAVLAGVFPFVSFWLALLFVPAVAVLCSSACRAVEVTRRRGNDETVAKQRTPLFEQVGATARWSDV